MYRIQVRVGTQWHMSGFTTASFLFKVDTRDAFNRFLDTPEKYAVIHAQTLGHSALFRIR